MIVRNNRQRSLWALLNKYFDAKKAYYRGNSKLTDAEFDALESSIVVIHGEDVLKKFGCVGYDLEKHRLIKRRLEGFDRMRASVWIPNSALCA